MSTLPAFTSSDSSSAVHIAGSIKNCPGGSIEKLKGPTSPCSAKFTVPWYHPHVYGFLARVSSTLFCRGTIISPNSSAGCLITLIKGQYLQFLTNFFFASGTFRT